MLRGDIVRQADGGQIDPLSPMHERSKVQRKLIELLCGTPQVQARFGGPQQGLRELSSSSSANGISQARLRSEVQCGQRTAGIGIARWQ